MSPIESYFRPQLDIISPSVSSAAAAAPPQNQTMPDRSSFHYEPTDIILLRPGPFHFQLIGRVVNILETTVPDSTASGSHKALQYVLKDDTGVVTVEARSQSKETVLHLGSLVAIWASHVFAAGLGGTSASSVSPFLIRLDLDGGQGRMEQIERPPATNLLCRKPLGRMENETLSDLLSVREVTRGGFELPDYQLLVWVKAVGPTKKVTTKSNGIKEVRNIILADPTGSIDLSLWGYATASADIWPPLETILLLRSPLGRPFNGKIHLSPTTRSTIEVNPDAGEAQRLRSIATKPKRWRRMNLLVDERDFPITDFWKSDKRALFTLAEVEEWGRAYPKEKHLGFLSVVIRETCFAASFRRQELFASECCGERIAANKIVTMCLKCATPAILAPNPSLIGSLLDESGSVSASMCAWTMRAWKELIGRDCEQLEREPVEILQELDDRMLCLRVTVLFGLARGKVAEGRLVLLSFMQG